jgi:gluconate 5-dehydrogenase
MSLTTSDHPTPWANPALNKVAVVTGVSNGGMGVVIARALARAGYRVTVVDHPDNAAELEHIATEISRDFAHCGGDSIAVPANITDEAAVATVTSAAEDRFGRLDLLVNNAGVMLRKDVFSTSLAEWNYILGVNLTGTWLTNRSIGRRLCEQGGGRIVNVASVYAERAGRLPESAYYASKAGIANLTRGLAAEFGPRGVTVNCVAPGVFYPTNMTKPLADHPDTLAAMTDRTMLGRLGNPATDIHGVVLFLASDEAAYITGQTIYVDGGWSAW